MTTEFSLPSYSTKSLYKFPESASVGIFLFSVFRTLLDYLKSRIPQSLWDKVSFLI